VAVVFSDRQRLDASPASSETSFAFLDRVAGPFWSRVRRLIEGWVADYSPPDRAEMVARLRKDFLPAYWELLLYHGSKALGFDITCHPELDGVTTRPDFLVEGAGCSFYLEAKVVGDGAAGQAAKRREDVEHGLNERVRSADVVVNIQYRREGTRPIAIARLAADVQGWLDGLDLAEVRRAISAAGLNGPTPFIWSDPRSGWSVVLTPMPRSGQGGERVVGIVGPMFSWCDDVTPIRKALRKKANKVRRPAWQAFRGRVGGGSDVRRSDGLAGRSVWK
jgi:hypothetical protein